MKTSGRQFLISRGNFRLQRLWRFFFTGWGLIMLSALVAGAILQRSQLWTPITAIDMAGITRDMFKMNILEFNGTDSKDNPFTLRAQIAYQSYERPEDIIMEQVSAKIVREEGKKRITDNISARKGIFNREEKTMLLSGNVKVISSDGNQVFANEMMIRM